MDFQIILAVVMGLGLAAAAGFRVFVPLLALSIAAKAGAINLDPSMLWLATTPALITLSVATLAEIVAYKIPWVDNALDTIATPAAVIAGTIAAASQFGFVGADGQLLKWGAAIIMGGGLAGVVQLGTVALRTLSLGLTGGVANPIIGTAESGSSIVMAALAILVPLVAGFVLLALGIAAVAIILHVRAQRRARAALAIA